jgi:glutaredoxin 3
VAPDILIYSKSTCPFCHRAKGLLADKGLRWKEIDIGLEPAQRRVMIEASRRMTVPQIFINGTHVGGSDDLFALDANGGLDRLLAG